MATMKKWFRKIHLWLSVPFGILITLICLSGALLVYEQEITEWCRPDLYFVQTVKEAPLPMEELMERVDATLPEGSLITGVTVSPDAKRTYQVSLSQPRRASLYVDPYTGEVKGQNERLPFFSDMFRLHRWLMGSVQSAGGGISVGKLLVGLSTLMMVIILITGLLMWLTNRKKPLTKSLTISFTKGWPRFWHDLHVAGGIYATILLLAMALTGLTWSFGWYRTGFYSLFGVEASAGGGHGQGGGNSNGQGNHSKGDQANGVSRQGRGNQGEGRGGRPEGAESHRPPRAPYAHWQQVYETLAESHPGYRQITLGAGTASVVPEGRNSLRAVDSYTFDARSGKLTDYKPYADQPRSAKLHGWIYTWHVGSWGGSITRLLSFLSALVGATLPLTGYYLWMHRLQRRKTGAKGPQ